MAETRPSSRGGVTDWRSVVVEITQRIGPAPSRKKLNPASHGLDDRGQRHDAGRDKAGDRTKADHGAEGEPFHHPRRQQRADDHADAIHRERRADAGRGHAEPPHGVGHEDGEHQEGAGIEDELRDEHRPQQRVMKHEGRAFLDILQRMTARRGFARGLVDP